MSRVKRIIVFRGQKGQALPLALVAMAVGALLVGPFLYSASVHSIATRNYNSSMLEQYSSEAGVEDAFWCLVNDVFAANLTGFGDSVTYTIDEPVNNIIPTVDITRGAGNVSVIYEIVSTAEDERTSVDVTLQGGNITIDSWKMEKVRG